MIADRLKIVPLKTRHASITPYLRQADIDELTAMTGFTPELAVAFTIAHTEKGYAVELDGKPEVIFGISGNSIWCVGTDKITQHPVMWYRISAKIFKELKAGYTYLENYVDTRNKLHLRWLKWLGFNIEEAKKLGNGYFHKIWWKED